MTTRRLLPVFLVLLQSGLTAARAHTHADDAGRAEAPHLHARELLDVFGPVHEEDGNHDGDHDHDALDLSAVMASAAPPTTERAAPDLASVEARPAVEAVSDRRSFPVGLPPSTAGPHRPLYLTLCTLTI